MAVARLLHDRSGSIALLTALCATVLFGVAGGAVDYVRWVNARNQTQNAIDSAVLSGGRAMQLTQSDESKAIAAAIATYRSMRSPLVENDTLSFAAANGGRSFIASGNAFVSTPFMRILGIAELPLFPSSEAIRAETVWSGGMNSETSVEMSLMLDTTGSMMGQKIMDLRLAAAEMVDIVVWRDQSHATSRVALVPFSSTVNVGSHVDAVIDPAEVAANPRAAAAACVVERSGAAEFTDEPPGPGAWPTSYNVASGSATVSCPESVPIVPLTNDTSRLKASISDIKSQHSTAGALGTAWAWYMLSPEWSGLWIGPSTPAGYDQLTTLGPSGAPKLLKIAVLMTDGTYNTYQAQQHSDRSSMPQTISDKAVQLCTGMKQKGIVVYTVGFQLDNDLARATLARCATSPAHFYEAGTGDELRLAFRDIGLKSTPLRIVR